MLRDGADDVDLWAMAAELERHFAGYKQRLTGRHIRGASGDYSYAAGDGGEGDDGGGGNSGGGDGDDGGGGSSDGGEGDDDGACGGEVRGRMYEAYTRRRDERLRSGWRARMERKEAEVMALWAQLGGETASTTGGRKTTTAGELVQPEAEEIIGKVRRRNSDAVAPPPPPRSISGKKHARARSFSSTNLLKSSRPDVAGRRALSQDPPSTSPSRKLADNAHGRGRAVGGAGAGAGAAAPKSKALVSARSKGSEREHGSLKHAAGGGTKPPRSLLPRRRSSGGLLLEGVVEREAAPVRTSCSGDRSDAGRGETRPASLPRPLVGNGGTPSERDGASASPDSDHGEVVDGVAAAAADGCEADEIKRDDEEITASPGKIGNGEITSDSETEPTYVYIKKKVVVVEEGYSETSMAGSDAKSHLDQCNTGNGNADEPTTAGAEERATTNAEEAPATARESSDESSFSCRCSPPNSAPSCSSRRPAQHIEALLRKKYDESGAMAAVSTPGSAGSRVSGTTQASSSSSPRETTPRGFKKRFLSFGKKNKGKEPVAIVTGCTSPSVIDDDGESGRWQAADSTRPRVGSSDAASDDTEHGYAASPQACSLQSLVAASPAKSELSEIIQREKSPKAHRPFFSLRSFNCGRAAD